MKLNLPCNIWHEMMALAQLSDLYEITGMGLIELEPDRKTFRVKKLYLPRQAVSNVSVETEEAAVNEVVTDVISENIEDAEKLRFRWHSHGAGSVFFSSIDEKDIDNWSADWVVNLVINNKGEHIARFDMFEPIRVENHPVEVVVDYLDGINLTPLRRQLAEKVRRRALTRHKKGGDNLAAKFFGSKKPF